MPDIAFAGSPLDRADHLRADSQALLRYMNGRARLLKLDGLDPVLDGQGRLQWATLADADSESELVFLGLDGDCGCFAEVQPGIFGSGAPAGPRSWAAMQYLEAQDLAIYGAARSIVGWHARHRYCAQCGAPTRLARGGWQRDCTSETCRAQHFPRVDPVTIMIVEHGDSLLLGRQPRFPPGNYSALAGFVEPGETLEEAVARETREEAGVVVRDVSYVFCQPWPYPSSLMIGCHAYADDPTISIDTTELEDARWFSRADVADALDAIERGEQGRAFGCPPRYAIAHLLMRWWVDKGR